MFARYHVEQLLAAAWEIARSDFSSFQRLFQTATVGRPLVLDDGITREWFDLLSPDGSLSIFGEEIGGRTPPPALVVGAKDGRGDPIVPMGMTSPGETTAIWKQPVSVTSLARNPELAQALIIFAGSAIESYRGWLMKDMMYSGVALSDVGTFRPEVRLMPERNTVYRSYITYEFTIHMRFSAIEEPAVNPLKVSVHHYDSVDAWGNPGQVRTEE